MIFGIVKISALGIAGGDAHTGYEDSDEFSLAYGFIRLECTIRVAADITGCRQGGNEFAGPVVINIRKITCSQPLPWKRKSQERHQCQDTQKFLVHEC